MILPTNFITGRPRTGSQRLVDKVIARAIIDYLRPPDKKQGAYRDEETGEIINVFEDAKDFWHTDRHKAWTSWLDCDGSKLAELVIEAKRTGSMSKELDKYLLSVKGRKRK